MRPEQPNRLTRGEIQQRASNGALWTGLSAIISLPLSIASTVLIARVLDVASYGQLAFFTVTFAVIAQVTDFGYTSAVVQWGSQARAQGDDSALGHHLSRMTGFHVLVQAPLYLIASLVVLRDQGVVWALVYGVANFCFLYISCASLALVLDQRNDLLAKIAVTTNFFIQALVIAAALTTHDAIVILVVRSVAGILPGLVAIFIVRVPLRAAALRPRVPHITEPGFWRFALYSWSATSIALLVFSRSEIIVLTALSTPQQAAFFALAFGISQQITGPVDALVAPLVPATASLVATHGEHLARAVQRAISLCSLLAGLLLAAGIPAVYGIFRLLYGQKYGPSAELFIALGAMSTFQTATNVVGLLVQAQRQGRRLLSANAAALSVNLVAAFALIPLLGAWGAMAANCCGQLVSIALLVRAAVSGTNGVSVSAIVRGLRPWLAAVPGLALGALVAAVTVSSLTGFGSAACGGLVGVGIYVAVLRLSNAGPPMSDLSALGRTLPAKFQRPAMTILSVVASR